jgi:hypothetical protein
MDPNCLSDKLFFRLGSEMGLTTIVTYTIYAHKSQPLKAWKA